MQRSTNRILTTQCGLPPPPGVTADFMAAKAAGQTDRAMELVARGVTETLARQAEMGIDVPRTANSRSSQGSASR